MLDHADVRRTLRKEIDAAAGPLPSGELVAKTKAWLNEQPWTWKWEGPPPTFGQLPLDSLSPVNTNKTYKKTEENA